MSSQAKAMDMLKKSPFLTIWIKPRATIRSILNTHPQRHMYLLAALYGIDYFLEQASERTYGDNTTLLFIIVGGLFLGPLAGLIGLGFGGVIFRLSGRWLGGQATTTEVRAALAWSSVPAIPLLILWIPKLLIFGKELFTTIAPSIESSPFLTLLLLWFIVIEGIIRIWSVFIYLKCLAEAHRFSVWRALGATLFPLIMIAAVIFGIWFLLMIIVG
jgi:hypothetical protein